MKIHQFVTAVCAAAFLTVGAQAENASANAQSGAQSSSGAQPSAQSNMNAHLIDAAKLDGQQVKNLQGQDLGKVKQLLMDPQSGRVRFAVIEVDKAMGLENSEIAVPFTALQVSGKPDDANFHLALDATKEKLQNAPKTKVGEADRLYSKESAEPIYGYWTILWFDDNANNATAGNQKGSGSSSNPGTAGSSSSAQPSNPATANSGATSRSNSGGNVTTEPGSGSSTGSGSKSPSGGNTGSSGSTTPPSSGSGSSTNNPSGATTGTPP